MVSSPTLSEVDTIARMSEPVLRNLGITQCYFEQSHALAKRLPGNANWCTFATWASKQAGQSIRGEDIRRLFRDLPVQLMDFQKEMAEAERMVNAVPGKPIGGGLGRQLLEVLDMPGIQARSSAAVARGNQKVFDEIARAFARFAESLQQDETADPEKLEQFCRSLLPGSPPDGQAYLQQAFRRYYQAMFEEHPKRRAELILLANVEIGFHEQTRLQPEIAEALDAAMSDPAAVFRRLITRLFPRSSWVVYPVILLMRFLGRPLRLEHLLRELISRLQRRIRLLLTEHLMVLCVPGKRLRLGQDLQAGFPALLQELEDSELLDFLQQNDPTPDSLKASGAADWADLPDRLHFIIDLFRCYQENIALFLPPFSPEQAARIKTGEMPEGEL